MKRYADDFDDWTPFGDPEEPPPSTAKTIIYTACWCVVAAIGLMVVVWAMFAGGKAAAHSWYPPYCCSGRDCGPVSDDVVEEQPDGSGYLIKPTGEVIPYGDTRIKGYSPDSDTHRCAVEGPASNSRTLCLYPRGGSS